MLLEAQGIELPKPGACELYVAPMGENESVKVFELVTKLRNSGVICDFDHMGRGIKAQFKYADKIGAEYVGVVGSDELDKGAMSILHSFYCPFFSFSI